MLLLIIQLPVYKQRQLDYKCSPILWNIIFVSIPVYKQRQLDYKVLSFYVILFCFNN